MASAAFALIAYLIGSVSFAVIVSRAFGLPDPRSYGSGNPGATNVLRSGKPAAAALTLIGDAAKGWLAVFLAERYAGDYALGAGTVAACALAVFLGHLFPLYFGFKGGKGVATAGGILFALNFWLGAATVLTWAIIAVFFRYASLASIVAAAFAPAYFFFLFGVDPLLPAVILIAALVVWRHRQNMLRLASGTERRIGAKRSGESGGA